MKKKKMYAKLWKAEVALELAEEAVFNAEREMEDFDRECDKLLNSIYDRLFSGVEDLKETPEADVIFENALDFDVTWIATEKRIKEAHQAHQKLVNKQRAVEANYWKLSDRCNNI